MWILSRESDLGESMGSPYKSKEEGLLSGREYLVWIQDEKARE